MASPSPTPSGSATPSGSGIPPPVNRHALTPLERQRSQLAKLLKDPTKPVNIPAPPKEKTIRPPREMMKNVQGSSAGAGSGEFHVYKANRRREYERLKMMEEESKKETEVAEFERKRIEREELAEAKTSKNRAKRMKKKERAKGKINEKKDDAGQAANASSSAPIKKRRLVNGAEMMFKLPGDESDEEEEEDGYEGAAVDDEPSEAQDSLQDPVAVVENKITIIDSDN